VSERRGPVHAGEWADKLVARANDCGIITDHDGLGSSEDDAETLREIALVLFGEAIADAIRSVL
jgi:hypothetical protein